MITLISKCVSWQPDNKNNNTNLMCKSISILIDRYPNVSTKDISAYVNFSIHSQIFKTTFKLISASKWK